MSQRVGRCAITLRNRLWLVLAGLVLLPLVVGGVLVATLVPRLQAQQAEARLGTQAAAVSTWVAGECRKLGALARGATTALAAVSPAEAAARTVADGGLRYAALLGADGQVLASAGELPARVAGPAGLSSCSRTAGGQALSERVRISTTGSTAASTVREVVVVAALDSGTLRRLVLTNGRSPDALLYSGDQLVAASIATGPAKALVARLPDRGRAILPGGRQADVQPAAAGSPFTVAVVDPPRDGGVLLEVVVFIVVAAALLVFLIGRQVARSLTRPLEALTTAAERVARGDLGTRVEQPGRDEVGQVARAFNLMTAQLQHEQVELERSQAEIREGLSMVGQTLLSTHDLDRLLAVLLATAVSAVRARCGLALLVESSGLMRCVASQGEFGRPGQQGEPELLGPLPDTVRSGSGVLGLVAAGAVVRGELGASPALQPAAGEPATGYVLAVPVRRGEQVVGALAVYDQGDAGRGGAGGFSEEDEQSLRLLAGQAGVAVDNVLLHREAQRLSNTDALTGVGNVRFLSTSLSREYERARRFRRPLSVLMLDLDHFKVVNDSYGHAVGDTVLREVARRIGEQVRDVDLVARYGGEEFVVILPETTGASGLVVAERIRQAIRRRPVVHDGGSVEVTASLGVAELDETHLSANQLLVSADTALYAAKGAGRDRCELAVSRAPQSPPR